MHMKDTAIVVASGPSAQRINLKMLKGADATIIAVNDAVYHVPFADYVFTLDTVHLQDKYDLPWFRGIKLAAVPDDYGRPDAQHPSDRVEKRTDVNFFRRTRNRERGAIHTGCSGYGAAQFAELMGAKRIILIGCDHTEQGVYFYGENRVDTPRYQQNWINALENWNTWRPEAEVLNASQISRITSVPKVRWPWVAISLGLPYPYPLVCVLKTGGEYNERHVLWLAKQVKTRVICLTDSDYDFAAHGIEAIPLKYNWPGWWAKMEMFREDLHLGDFIFSDLDTVIKDLPLVDSDTPITLEDAFLQPWANSGFMYVPGHERKLLWQHWIFEPEKIMSECGEGGDQRYIDRWWRKHPRWQHIYPGQIFSYNCNYRTDVNHHLKKYSIEGAKVIYFHGKPRPWNVDEPWVPKLF